jgi:hypothetical protein
VTYRSILERCCTKIERDEPNVVELLNLVETADLRSNDNDLAEALPLLEEVGETV